MNIRHIQDHQIMDIINGARMSDIVEFLGIEVDIKKISNPHLKRVVSEKSKSGYRFGYNDHSESSGQQYSDHRDYSDYREKYHEYSVYADNVPGYHDAWPGRS
jgi:hypothetical protein